MKKDYKELYLNELNKNIAIMEVLITLIKETDDQNVLEKILLINKIVKKNA